MILAPCAARFHASVSGYKLKARFSGLMPCTRSSCEFQLSFPHSTAFYINDTAPLPAQSALADSSPYFGSGTWLGQLHGSCPSGSRKKIQPVDWNQVVPLALPSCTLWVRASRTWKDLLRHPGREELRVLLEHPQIGQGRAWNSNLLLTGAEV